MRPDSNKPNQPAIPDFIPASLLDELEDGARVTVVFDRSARELDSTRRQKATLAERARSVLRSRATTKTLVALITMVLVPMLWVNAAPTPNGIFVVAALTTTAATYVLLRQGVQWLISHKQDVKWLLTEAGERK